MNEREENSIHRKTKGNSFVESAICLSKSSSHQKKEVLAIALPHLYHIQCQKKELDAIVYHSGIKSSSPKKEITRRKPASRPANAPAPPAVAPSSWPFSLFLALPPHIEYSSATTTNTSSDVPDISVASVGQSLPCPSPPPPPPPCSGASTFRPMATCGVSKSLS